MALTKISTGGVKDDAASQAKIADEAVDEARLQISNAGSNGQFLSKQSGNTGGLTWATVSVPDSDKIEEGNTSVETVDTGSDGHVSIKTEGTERLKVRNDGIIDIGGTGSANVNLGVKGTSGTSNVGKVGINSAYSNVPNGENIALGQVVFGHGTNNSGPIIEGASGGLWSTNNLPSALKFYTVPASSTTQTERFRISKDGSLGVGGANYGTSGQVLTSGGNAAAPSWADIPPAGNTIDLVADGAIAAGKPCIIKSNGKAQQVQLLESGKDSVDFNNTSSASYGITQTNDDVHGRETRMAFDPTTKKIVHVSRGTTDSDWYAQIGTENSSNSMTIDWTSETTIHDNSSGGATWYTTTDLCYAGNSRFLFVYTLNSGKSVVKIGKATSSGFSWSSQIDLYATDSKWSAFSICKLTDDRVALLAKARSGNGPSGWTENKPGILIIDIASDTSITYRSFTQLDTDDSENENPEYTLTYDPTNAILFATWETTGGVGRCCALKVASGTSATITKSSSNVQIDDAISTQSVCYSTAYNKFVIAWYGHIGVNPGTEIKVATVNSTSLAVTIADGGTTTRLGNRGIRINEGIDGDIYLTVVDSSQNMYMHVSTDFAGGSFTFASPSDGRAFGYSATDWYYFDQIFISDFGSGKNMLVLSGGGTSDQSTWYTYKVSSSQTNFSSDQRNFIGFAPSAINDGATGTINLAGNIVGNQSSLTPGLLYKTDNDGSLTQAWGNGEVGLLAVASDKGQVIRSLV